MTALRKLFQHTFIYGLATVLPRMLSFLLVPLYTAVLPVTGFGEITVVFSWIILFNIILAYGMETAFFRFFTKEKDKQTVVSTATISLIFTSFLFLLTAFTFREGLAALTGVAVEYITYALFVLTLDALVIIPFAWLRANEKPMRYAVIKILNVAVNLGLNVFFLLALPKLASDSFWSTIYKEDFELSYIFISMIAASVFSFLLLLPFYFSLVYKFSKPLWMEMMRYAFPVLIAGIAFAINEAFDKILLNWILPEDVASAAVGAYAACYKLAIFMTLFATAFRLGIEPFFFSQAKEKNAPETYALITRFFVAFGSVILITVVVFADVLKIILIRDSDYWVAMKIVPLILLANFFLGIYHNLSVWYKVTDRTKMGAYISLVGAAITLIINFTLIPSMSFMGSAIATLAAYGSMMLISFYLGQKYFPIPYHLRKMGVYIVGSVVISGLSFYFFRNSYALTVPLWLGFLTLVLILEKQAVLQLLRLKK